MLLHDERVKLRELLVKAGLSDVLPQVDALVVGTPCSECMNYVEPTGRCEWWNDAIPAEHLEKGCEAWVRLPF